MLLKKEYSMIVSQMGKVKLGQRLKVGNVSVPFVIT